MRRLSFLLFSLSLLLVLLLPAAAQASAKPTFDQAIDQLIAQGYPQAADAHIAAMGTNPGSAFAGPARGPTTRARATSPICCAPPA